jgi:hypothetical protein
MPMRPNLALVLVLGGLPALGVGVPARPVPFVASFMYACDSSEPVPHVRSTYTAAGKPTELPGTHWVEVFERGKAPTRHFVIVGHVQVLASSSRNNAAQLTGYAQREARKMAGDALVEMTVDDAASMQPPAGDRGLLALSASVARWQ